MNIQRFTAATSREALAKARIAFGEGTLILSNRATENGVEVVATGEDTLAELDQGVPSVGMSYAGRQNGSAPRGQQKNNAKASTGAASAKRSEPSYQEVATQVEDDATQLSMSTLSFQDYVRERMAKRRQDSGSDATLIRIPQDSGGQRPSPIPTQRSSTTQRSAAAPQRTTAAAPQRSAATANAASAAPSARSASAAPAAIERELHAMKELIEDRFNTLNWLGQARQNPVQANLMLRLIRAGYSPTLSRTILERMPDMGDAAQSMRWVCEVLERNLRTDAAGAPLHEEGGIFALIGATGVGKTTTTAKLAAQCVQEYGAASVGLITLDSYRVGGQEQLRSYGKMLGVVAHLAHDRAALQDLLGLLSAKRMVLIDTTGVAPRDPRKSEIMDLLEVPGIKRLLVLNAGGHGDTLDDTVSNFKSNGAQQVIFSKIDEAVKLGPAIDAAIRHQLVLRGVTTGQRVPQDWEEADAAQLVQSSIRTTPSSAHDPQITDLGFIFSSASAAHGSNYASASALHA